ncbi:hypothetical protein HUT18_21015 [Streptomyces sp. NA04227]|uniref:hypothetical protein n=1 Tax=Streptomyces sp. NA04227 TaxID=2742136 RepID=UPI0015915532|nr:hypothetical protein [Streptomyces sp. NA04227]QKW08479.1 hypothetical protein HUT18_21015 [Streptomyces sp. NA04227]
MLGSQGEEPPVAPVHWQSLTYFTVTDLERGAGPGSKPVKGRLAVRRPKEQGARSTFAPGVFVVPAEDGSRAYRLHEADGEGELLCRVTPVPGTGGERFRVNDELGTELGTVHRTPAARRTVQHGWWLTQPGYGEVVARYHWVKGSVEETTGEPAGAFLGGMFGALSGLGAEDGDQPTASRKPVTWVADGKVAMTSQARGGYRAYLVRAPWLDQRLAFALAVLREV